MDGGCIGCRFAAPVYMGDGEELLTACVYLLRTGHRRPCPPGDGCRVFEPACKGKQNACTAVRKGEGYI